MKKIYQYTMIDFKRNTLDLEEIPYKKVRGGDIIYRSGRLFYGKKPSYKICKIDDLNKVLVNFSKGHLFIYLNCEDKISMEDAWKMIKYKMNITFENFK